MNEQLPAHAKYAPSAASRWLYCSASVAFKEPEGEAGPQAKLGTEIHEWLVDTSKPMPAHWGREDRDAAVKCFQEWIKHVPITAAKEQKLYSKQWPTLLFGTIDAIWFDGTTCHIRDLKTGLRGVGGVDNLQLAVYALLAQDNFPNTERWNVQIIQPRRFYVGGATYDGPRLADIRERVTRAIEDPPTYKAGPHCEFCPARGGCPDLHGKLRGLLATAKAIELWSENV